MDTIVQLVRNFLCCIKDLNLFPTSQLYNASLVNIPHPLHETTPLEVLIGITQFYAFASCTLSGYRLFTSGYRKYTRLTKLTSDARSAYDKKSRESTVCRANLSKSLDRAVRDYRTGVCVFAIGFSFIWLTANSFHITAAGWIGGLPALIHALTVAEIGLGVLLCFMVSDAMSKWGKAKRLRKLGNMLEGCEGGYIGGIKDLEVDEEVYSCLSVDGWTPFWNRDDAVAMDATKLLKKEAETVKATLDKLMTKTDKDDDKMAKASVQQARENCLRRAEELRKEGWMEYIFFIMNFVAFYGYALCVVVYYFEKDDETPNYVYYTKFGMFNDDADWRGNFAGDFMWTLEPLVVLGSPLWIRKAPSGDRKVKKE